MAFCTNCGQELVEGAKFCSSCGTPTTQTNTKRETVYEGIIHKCPNCGEVLNSFVSNCPSCGYEIRGSKNSSAVCTLVSKLEEIEAQRPEGKQSKGLGLSKTDEQKINLISNFPIPNTKEDLYEFLILAASNINADLYDSLNGEINKITNKSQIAVSDAWKSKFEQAYVKAKILLSDDPRFGYIQELYSSKHKSIKKAKGKAGRTIAIVYGVLSGVLALALILGLGIGLPLAEKAEREEIQRLENLIVQVENALGAGEYQLALMNADRLVFKGTDENLYEDWEIQREYWIDKVIEEAAKNGVILERPVKRETRIGVSSSDLRGKNYLDVKKQLENKGFTNIRTEVYEESLMGWLEDEGSVAEVSVGGDTIFSKEDIYSFDTEIIIFYYDKDNINSETDGTTSTSKGNHYQDLL